jgi:4-amino-4-deoxy-L-arabinose transferase-like glycosyltransferase
MKQCLHDYLAGLFEPDRRLFFILLSVMVLVLYIPFIGKAFHIDDPNFIVLSQQLGWNPFKIIAGTPYSSSHPFLNPYFIKIARAMFGESEVALHICHVVFFVMVLASVYDLVRVVGGLPRGTALLIMVFFGTMPAFLVSAHSIMADVPMVAFLLLAFSCYGRGFRHESVGDYAAGSCAMALALLISYQALAFLPLILMLSFLKKRISWKFVLSVAFPILVFGGFLTTVYIQHGYSPVKINLPQKQVESAKAQSASLQLNREQYKAPLVSGITDEIFSYGLNKKIVQGKLFAVCALLGSSCMFILPVYFFCKDRWKLLCILILSISVAAYPIIVHLFGYPSFDASLLALLCSLGMIAIGTAIFEVRQYYLEGSFKAEALFAIAWIAIVIAYCIIVLPFASARYLLPVFPPLLLLILGGISEHLEKLRNKVMLALTIILSICFGLLNAYSDYYYADTYRKFAAEIKSFRQERGNGIDVWYIGSWGMHHYLENAGARLLKADSNEPRIGDYVVIPSMPDFWEPSDLMKNRLKVYTTVDFNSQLPLRLFNRSSNAGFYSHLWGLLPFTFSRKPDEVFKVLLVCS